jgi:hypothetical protein
MEQEFILLTIFIIAAVFITLLSLYVIRISKNDEPDYPHNHSYRYICGVIGLFVSILFSILVVILFINGDFNPENRLQTKSQQVTSVEKSGDKITIYNSDSYKIVIDLKENTENLYHNSEKLGNVTINGYWDLKDNFQDIKNKNLIVNTDYTISKKGDVKSVYIEVVKNKNKDDFKVEY